MIFPLAKKNLIRGCAAHIKAGLGCGADYVANYDPFYAPFDAKILLFSEIGGGDWVRFTRADGLRIELAHLSERFLKTGQVVKEGQHCGVTGNTGVTTTGPHLHAQGFDPQGRRIDVDLFFKDAPLANTIMNEDLENFALIQNPGGNKGFFRGGLLHIFANQVLGSAYENYTFQKTAKFVEANRYNSLPRGTLTAEQVLKGEKDW